MSYFPSTDLHLLLQNIVFDPSSQVYFRGWAIIQKYVNLEPLDEVRMSNSIILSCRVLLLVYSTCNEAFSNIQNSLNHENPLHNFSLHSKSFAYAVCRSNAVRPENQRWRDFIKFNTSHKPYHMNIRIAHTTYCSKQSLDS